ncbi:unnamed protein product [Hymenolepis diminuta]|uniref:Neur_chan_LBD domain-containing protein n=1 Tax=Hymenolepis diminuta TaxID=6216 RepID=A0A0R3SCM0_HYMDI|nr:unnamed protein product [Hymenolepis diminuta]
MLRNCRDDKPWFAGKSFPRLVKVMRHRYANQSRKPFTIQGRILSYLLDVDVLLYSMEPAAYINEGIMKAPK